MSYILDALRRADAERGRGAVPGLHTQASPATGAPLLPERGGQANLWLLAAGVVGVAALAAGGTWWALRSQAPAVPVAVASAPASSPAVPPAPVPVAPAVAVAPAPPPEASPAPVEPAAPPRSAAERAAPPARPAPPPEARTPERRSAEPRSAAAPREAPREREREKRSTAAADAPAPAARGRTPEPARPRDAAPGAGTTAPAPAARSAPEAAVAPPPAAPVFTQAELPEALRTQLPVLKVTGATHSSNPVYRMAIVNGQVLHEGDQAAPGLVLERIEPGRTIWAFRGYRYAVAAQ